MLKRIHYILFGLSGLLFLVTLLLVFISNEFLKYSSNNPSITIYDSNKDSSSGLVSHWQFDKKSNHFTPDISGNQNHGSLRSHNNFKLLFGEPDIVTGKVNGALEFNGKQWVSGKNLKAYNTDYFTISVWVWREHDDAKVPTIMAKGSWPYDGWWLCTKPYTKFIDMGVAWGEAFTHIESGYELPLKEWHHIAVTMNNSDHEIQFFIDGLPFGKKHQNVHEWLINWNHDLFIGEYDGSARWPWFGKLDDVRYYNVILSEDEIYKIYSGENI